MAYQMLDMVRHAMPQTDIQRINVEHVKLKHKHKVEGSSAFYGPVLASTKDPKATLSAVAKGKLFADVRITEGALEGLNRTVQLPTPRDTALPPIELNIGKLHQRHPLGPYNANIGTSKNKKTKESLIRMKTTEYEGTFEIELVMSGKIIVIKTDGVVYELTPKALLAGGSYPDLERKGDKIVWKLKGVCEYKVDYSSSDVGRY